MRGNDAISFFEQGQDVTAGCGKNASVYPAYPVANCLTGLGRAFVVFLGGGVWVTGG